MSWMDRIPGSARLRQAAAAVWTRDRTRLRGPRGLANRVYRITVAVARGIVAHRVALLAAALTFFTVFSIVPTLVVVLWVLKAMDHLPVIGAELPRDALSPSGNQLLHAALRQMLDSVRSASQAPGLIGLVALLYVAAKLFAVTEKALYTIAGGGARRPRFVRALGYVALLTIPGVALALTGLLFAALRTELPRALRLIPRLDLTVLSAGAALGIALLCLEATILYWSAVRARIPLRSAAVGGIAAGLTLPVVFWAYANLGLGVAKGNVMGAEFVAFPVFLLWAFSSWYLLLVGAEIAVAHQMDVVLARGARAFHLDLDTERQAAAAIVLRLAREARQRKPPSDGSLAVVTDDDLARELRLPPHLVRELCVRLVQRGLLVEKRDGFALRNDPDRTAFASVVEAVERDPCLDDLRRETALLLPSAAQAALSGPRPAGSAATVGQLADAADAPP